ncbi:hypothetical protein HKX48_002498, partial [Thoreauomyces humboldtii]
TFANTDSAQRTLSKLAGLAVLGWRVTVVAMAAGREDLMKFYYMYTHDVFIVPYFLRAPQFIPFIEYIVKSRGIDTILISQSELAYQLMASEINDWSAGGFATVSAIHGRHIHRTIAHSDEVKNHIVKRGRAQSYVTTIPLKLHELDMFMGGRNATELRQSVLQTMGTDNVVQPEGCVIGYYTDAYHAEFVGLLSRQLHIMSDPYPHMLKFKFVAIVPPSVRRATDIPEHLEFRHEADESVAFRAWIAASNVLVVASTSPTATDVTLLSLALGVPVVTIQSPPTTEAPGAPPPSFVVHVPIEGEVISRTILDRSFCIGPRTVVSADVRLAAQSTLMGDPELFERQTKQLVQELDGAPASGFDVHMRPASGYYAIANAVKENPLAYDIKLRQEKLHGYQRE